MEWLYSVSTSAAELGSSTLTDEVAEEDLLPSPALAASPTPTLTPTPIPIPTPTPPPTPPPNPPPDPQQVSEEDLALRRQELSAVHAELARLLRQIAMALPAAEQAASASTMLDYLVAPLPSDALHFDHPSASSATGEDHITPAALSLRPAGSPQLAAANTALLDALCAVLAQHPRVRLRT